MKKNITNLLVNKDSSIKEAMGIIDRAGLGVVFVVDENKQLFGVVTDGDIRKAILKGIDIKKPIQDIVNKKPIVIEDKFVKDGALDSRIKQKIKKHLPIITGSLKVPVIDKKREIKDIFFISSDEKENFFYQDVKNSKIQFNKEGIKKVLLIGGAGYLGSVLSRKLLDRGYKVKVLDNLTYRDEGIKDLYENKNFDFLKGDIRNISNIVEAIKGVDAVVHLAAIVGDPACIANPEETLEINYLATKNIVETCKYFQVNRFLFSSTCSVYGKSSFPEQKLTEESGLSPISLYAETKIKCEQEILEAIDENFSPTIFRMATLYGYSKNMRFDLPVNLIAAKAFFDKKIIIFGGEQWRPWLHLEDAAQAYIACLEEPIERIRGEVFNLVSENYKLIEIGRIINSLCPEAKLEINKEAKDQRDYKVSFDKISQVINYQPKKEITDGVLEIKNLIKKGLIKDYKDPKYRTV